MHTCCRILGLTEMMKEGQWCVHLAVILRILNLKISKGLYDA